MHKKLTAIIRKIQALISAPPVILSTYAELTTAVIQKELVKEIGYLKAMVALRDSQAINERFVILCRNRDKRNTGTLLHFMADSLGHCNTLYFEIAKTLYPEASFLALFKLLLPAVTHQWVIEHSVEVIATKFKRKKIERIQLHETTVDEIGENPLKILPKELSAFKRMIVVGNRVFVLDQIACFDFDLHCNFYQLLENNPRLKTTIKSHNDELGKLYDIIETLGDEVLTLRDFITPIVQSMALSGESIFGSAEAASMEGNQAAQRLVRYYSNLDDNTRQVLNNCAGFTPFYLIIESIKREDCIESISEDLRRMLQDEKNQDLLSCKPYLSRKDKKDLAVSYQASKDSRFIEIGGSQNTHTLPLEFLQIFYQSIHIKSIELLLFYLLMLPNPEYERFLHEIILTEAAVSDLRNVLRLKWMMPSLKDEQRSAFLDGMLSLRDKFQLPLAKIFQEIGEHTALAKLLESLPIKSRLAVLKEHSAATEPGTLLNSTLLQSAVFKYPDSLEILLMAIPKNKSRFAALQVRNSSGDSAYELAAKGHLNALAIIFKCLPKTSIRKTLIDSLSTLGTKICKNILENESIQQVLSDELLEPIRQVVEVSSQKRKHKLGFFDPKEKKVALEPAILGESPSSLI